MKNDLQGSRLGVLDVEGAHCPSCAFTLEKLGRRVPGVREVRVDYDGAPGTLERFMAIVVNLGYSATVRQA